MSIDSNAGGAGFAIDAEVAARLGGLPPTDLTDPVAARAQGRALHDRIMTTGSDAGRVTVDDTVVPGEPAVPVRIYRPRDGGGGLPAILWIHGGGFVRGSVDIDDALAARAAVEAQSLVVSVEYRLAPEHPFPAALDDCYATLCWLSDQAEELSIDAERIAVAGYSAGGGLAAGVALLARDRGGPSIRFQALGVPVLDDRLLTASMSSFVDTPLWNRPLAELSWQHYLGGDRADVSQYAAPARAVDLQGLPPAYISTAEFDPLRDEGIAYGARLLEAGVPVELHQFSGAVHGSHLFIDTAAGARQSEEFYDVLRIALGAKTREELQ